MLGRLLQEYGVRLGYECPLRHAYDLHHTRGHFCDHGVSDVELRSEGSLPARTARSRERFLHSTEPVEEVL